MTYYIQMEDGTNTYKFIMRLIGDIGKTLSSGVTPMNIPGASYKETLLMAFEGQSMELEISCKLYYDNTDVADGTYSSTVKTIQEQEDYLLNEICSKVIDSKHKLFGDSFPATGLEGKITKAHVREGDTTPLYRIVDIMFTIGTNL